MTVKNLIKLHYKSIENKSNYYFVNPIDKCVNAIYLSIGFIQILYFCAIYPATVHAMEPGMSISQPQTVIHVSSSSELMSALAAAKGGETILLSGGDYGALNLYDARQPFVKFAETVTIKSADPETPASFAAANLSGVENLSFDSIKFDYVSEAGAPTWAKPFLIQDSQNITISNSVFDGDLAHGVSEDVAGTGTGQGLVVWGSKEITVENTEFLNWHRAGVFGGVDTLTVKNNDVHSIRSDGFDFAAVQNVLIEGNHLHESVGAEGGGDHMDMIQFWTNGSTTPTTNVVIRGNILDSGSGSGTQSIFMRNEEVDNGRAGEEMFYQNILIEDNVIYNSHLHGITVGEATGLIIRNNTILQNQDSGDSGGVTIPTINIAAASTDVQVINNIVPRLSIESNDNVQVDNNLVVQRDFPEGPNYYGTLFVDALADSNAKPGDLMALPGGVIEQLGVGSSLTRFATQPETPTGYIIDNAGTGLDLLTHEFDATNLYGPEGQIDTTGASFVWSFGDGLKAEGPTASHTYEHAREYVASVSVTLADGRTLNIDKTIVVETPVALNANFDSGAQDLSDDVNGVSVGEGVTFEEGMTGQAAHLNGGLVSYDATPEFFNNSEYTLLFDFKKDQASDEGRLINFSGSFVIFISPQGVQASVVTDAGSGWLKADWLGLNDTEWHRLALTFSGKEGAATLYVDGQEAARMDGLVGGVQTGDQSHGLHLGNPWGEGFPGLVDNLKFLRGTMGSEDIKTNYDQRFEEPTTEVDPAPDTTDGEPDAPDPQEHMNKVLLEESDGIVAGSDSGDLFTGTEARDVAKGLDGDDIFFMAGGDDHVNAGAGNDEMHGGAGDDYLHGFGGFDTAFGGEGNDTIYANLAYGDAGDDSIYGSYDTADTLYGGDGNDQIDGYSGDDALHGDAGHDTLKGAEGDDWLEGGNGNDTLWGHSGADVLFGGEGNDGLGGGDGADILDGGAGADYLSGGAGDDILVFDAMDVVHGHSGLDTLQFADGDASDVALAVLDIYSIEAVDMQNGAANVLTLGYRDILQSDTDAMYIDGDANDTVVLKEDMQHLGTVQKDGQTYEHYSYAKWAHQTELYVDSNVNVEGSDMAPGA